MPWAKVDDRFYDHPKTVAVGTLGAGLFVLALSYASNKLTDGFIPTAMIRRLVADVDDPIALANGLVKVELFEQVDGGYQIHDYLDYNPSAAKVIAEREAAKERMRATREANTDECSGEVQPNFGRSSTPPVPVPIPIPMTPNSHANTNTDVPTATPKPPPQHEPYTEEQQRFLGKFNAKRFHNYTQVEVIKALMEKYPATFWEAVEWAAERGMALGIAIGAIKKALPNWNKHQSHSGGKPAKPPEEIPSLEDANRILRSQGKPEVTQQELEELYGVHR